MLQVVSNENSSTFFYHNVKMRTQLCFSSLFTIKFTNLLIL